MVTGRLMLRSNSRRRLAACLPWWTLVRARPITFCKPTLNPQQLVIRSLADGSGHLDRTELQQLVEMMSEQAALALSRCYCI